MKKTKISDLKLDQRNFNKGTAYGNSLIEKSLRKFGAGRSILIDRNGNVIAGNKTLENAAAIGMEDVQIIETDGKKIIAVKRMDIDLDSPDGRELALADNATAKSNIDFDTELIEEIIEEEILEEEVFEEWGIDLPKKEVEQDDFDETPPVNPFTKKGDIWELNEHRVQCGDSCDAYVVGKTLNGAKPILCVTDPPYGVEYDANWRNEADRSNGRPLGARATGKVQNDHKADWLEAFTLFPGDVIYCWHADRHAKQLALDIEGCGFEIVNQIIWAKNNIVIGRGDYHWKHEPCWYAVRKGKKHNWQGSRKEATVWEIDKPHKSETGHSTQKPIECMARPIRNNTAKGESVYDPFLGSGTTLIAGEQLDRTVYGQEIDEGYCDLIVKRWIKHMKENDKQFTVKHNGTDITSELEKTLPL